MLDVFLDSKVEIQDIIDAIDREETIKKKYEMINIKDRSPVGRPVLFRYDKYSNYKGETKRYRAKKVKSEYVENKSQNQIIKN